MTDATVLTGPERRRRWSEENRRRIVAAAFSPGAVVTAVARRYEVSTALIYRWRQEAGGVPVKATFAPAEIVDGQEHPLSVAAPPGSAPAAEIVVELASGACVRIGAGTCPALAAAPPRELRS